MDTSALPPEIQEKIYRPGEDGAIKNVEIDFKKGTGHISSNQPIQSELELADEEVVDDEMHVEVELDQE